MSPHLLPQVNPCIKHTKENSKYENCSFGKLQINHLLYIIPEKSTKNDISNWETA
jgi:hypothetical protein